MSAHQEKVDQVADDDDAHVAMLVSMGFNCGTAKKALDSSNGDVDVALECLLTKGMSRQEVKKHDSSSISKKKASHDRQPQHIPWPIPGEESGVQGNGRGLYGPKGNDIPPSDGGTASTQRHEQELTGNALRSREFDRTLTRDEAARELASRSPSHPSPRRPGAEAIEGMGSSVALPPGYTHRPSNLVQPHGEDVLVSAELVADADYPEGPDPSLVFASPSEDIPSRRDIRRIYILGAAIVLVVLVAVAVAVVLVLLLGNDESSPNSADPIMGQTTPTPIPGTSPPTESHTTQPTESHTQQPTESTTPPNLTYCGFTMLEGYDLSGGDITSTIPLNMTFDDAVKECKDICAALPSCDSFAVDASAQSAAEIPFPVENPFHNFPPLCFVMDSVASESSRVGMTSGIKTSTSTSCSRPSASYDTLPSTDLFGNDHFLPCVPLDFAITLDTATTVCQDICSAMSRCEAYSAVDPDIGPNFSVFGCCIKDAVSYYEEGSEPLVNSGIKL